MDEITENGKTVHRNINLKNLEVHPTEQTLILNCELEACLSTDSCENSFLEVNREFQRYIRLKSLQETSDIDSIVSQVIAKSKGLLTESHRDEIKQLIVYLKNRSIQSAVRATATGATFDSFRPKTAGGRLTNSNSNQQQQQFTNGHNGDSSNGHFHRARLTSSTSVNSFPSNGLENRSFVNRGGGSLALESIFSDIKRLINRLPIDDANENVNLNSVDYYAELFYEDNGKKLKGASAIYQLALNHDNLLALSNNEPLHLVLARLLREDGRKNLDLGTILIGIFANFSIYRQFHPIITKYKVGALCLEAVQGELEREEILFADLADIQEAMKSECHSLSNSIHSSMSYSHLSTLSAPNSGLSSSRQSSAGLTSEYERSLRKYQNLVVKQNLFLRAAYTVLLHLSEDRNIEIKMVNKGIIGCLVKTLDRENWFQLLFLSIQFLKRLSVYEENKDSILSMGIVDKLSTILENQITSSSIGHLINTLELVYNLSFDSKFRSSIIHNNLVSKIFSFLPRAIKSQSQPSSTNGNNLSFTGNNISSNNLILEKLIYQIIYLLTIESKHRVLVTLSLGPDRIHLLTDRVIKHLNDPKKCLPFTELIGLVINLSTNRRNAQLICDKDRLKRLLDHIVTLLINGQQSVTQDDIMILKLIRNLSQHEDSYKMIYLDYLESLVSLLVKRSPQLIDSTSQLLLTQGNQQQQLINEDNNLNCDSMVSIEILGILGNMINLPGVDWLTLSSSKGLFKWISSVLSTRRNSHEDDLILECIQVISCLINNRESCLYALKFDCLKLLINTLNGKQEEDEIVLQIIFTFHLMLREPDVRKMILSPETQVMAYLFDLMNDKNQEIRKLCKASLNIIFEAEDGHKDKIREESFKIYNKQWLEMILSRQENQCPISEPNGRRRLITDTPNNYKNSDKIYSNSNGDHDFDGDDGDENYHFRNNDDDLIGMTYNNLVLRTDILSESPPSSGPTMTDDQEASSCSINESTINNQSSLINSRPQTGYKKRGTRRTIKSSSIANDQRSTVTTNTSTNIIHL